MWLVDARRRQSPSFPRHAAYSSSSSRPRFRPSRCPFFTFAPREAPPAALSEAEAVADCALATKADWGPEVTDELENIRSASRNRLIRRIAPLLAWRGGREMGARRARADVVRAATVGVARQLAGVGAGARLLAEISLPPAQDVPILERVLRAPRAAARAPAVARRAYGWRSCRYSPSRS